MALTKVTYSMIDGAAVNVVDYGADNTGSSNASAAIQAALDSGANSVYFPDGTFLIDEALDVPSNMTLFGTGTLKLKANTNDNILKGTAVSNVTIDNLNFDGNKANQSAGTALIVFKDNGVTRSSNIKITKCNVYDGYVDGIGFEGVEYGVVSNCHIYNHNQHGYYSGGGAALSTEEITIIGNTLKDCSGAGIIPMGNGKHTTVTGNALYNCGGNGDSITCYDVDNEYTTISNNVIIDSGNHGIHAGGRYTSITGNVIKNPTSAGILFRAEQSGSPVTSNQVAISGNTVEKTLVTSSFLPYSACIVVRGVENFSITGNVCKINTNDEVYGINVNTSSYGVVSGNAVSGGWFGITITTAARTSISGNSLSNQNQDAINCTALTQSVISGNNTINSGLSVGAGTGYALKLDATSSIVLVSGNNFRETPESTLVSDAASNTRFYSNFYSDGANFYDYGAVAAASSIALPSTQSVFLISGSSTSISTITGGWEGRTVILTFTNSQTLVYGTGTDAINLTSGTNYSAVATTVLTLVYRGTNWVVNV